MKEYTVRLTITYYDCKGIVKANSIEEAEIKCRTGKFYTLDTDDIEVVDYDIHEVIENGSTD